MRLADCLKTGLARYRRSPAAFLFIALLIGTATSAAMTVFQLCETVLMRPLPIRDPNQLVQLFELRPRLPARGIFPKRIYDALSAESSSVTDWVAQSTNTFIFRNESRTEPIYVDGVSPNYFTALGVSPLLGRFPAKGDRQLAVISYRFWQRALGGDDSVLGRVLTIDGRSFRVIGVTSRTFNGTTVDHGPDVRISLDDVAPGAKTEDDMPWVAVIGRLRAGNSLAQAQQEIPLVVLRSFNRRPGDNGSQFEVHQIDRGTSWLRQEFGVDLLAVLAGTALVLLAVCINTSSFLLVRAAARQKETAVRQCLGASSGHIILEYIFEGLTPSLIGWALGVAASIWFLPIVIALLPPIRAPYEDLRPLDFDVHLGHASAVWGLAASIAAALLASIGPAGWSLSQNLSASIRSTTGNPPRRWLQESLGALQLALSLVLLISAGSLLRTWRGLETVPTGLDVDHVAQVSLDLSMNHYDGAQTRLFQRRAMDAIRLLPGVASAGYSVQPALQGKGMFIGVTQPGVEQLSGSGPNCNVNRVGSGYFETMGIRLIAGRLFQEWDGRDESMTLVVVNETFVSRFVPNVAPIGWRFATGRHAAKPSFEILGVVRNAAYGSVKEAFPPTVYMQGFRGEPEPPASFVVNVRAASGGAARMLESVQGTIRQIDAAVAPIHASTLRDDLEGSLKPERFVLLIASCFALMSMALSIVGLYGLLARFVAATRRDIGVRMALGASKRDIAWVLAKRLAPIIAIGAILGTAGSIAAGARLHGVMKTGRFPDPSALAGSIALLILVAAATSIVPLIHAFRIDPARTIREE